MLSGLRTWLVGAAAAALVVIGFTAPANAVVAGPYGANTWGTNGRVTTIVPVGDRVYIGGDFTAVIDPAGNSFQVSNLAVFIPSTGAFDLSFQGTTDGQVNALSVSGSSLYIGGSFSHVDGANQSKLAAVSTTDGSLLPWAASANNPVNAILAANGVVYVGGSFTTLSDANGTYANPYIGMLDPTTGAVNTSWKPNPTDEVNALAISPSGQQLFVGGDFVGIQGVTKFAHMVALNPNTGAIAWTTAKAYGASNTRPPVLNFAVDGTRLFVAAGGGGGTCASIDGPTGALLWTNKANGDVQAVAVSGGQVYCGGHFIGTKAFNSATRNKLAVVDEVTNALSTFNPTINSALGIFALAPSTNSGTVFLGGDFTLANVTNSWGVKAYHLLELIPTAERTVPGAPQNLIARPGNAAIRLSWEMASTDGGSSVYSYQIFRAKPGKAFTKIGATAKVGTTTTVVYTDATAANGVTYQYEILGVNNIGKSVYSNVVTQAAAADAYQAPTKPTNFAATSAASQVDLTWAPPSDNGGQPITSYTILRGDSTGTETPIATVDGSTLAYNDNTVTVKQTYYYTVLATNAIGDGATSPEVAQQVIAQVPDKPVMTATVVAGSVVTTWNTPNPGDYPITKYTIVRNSVQYAHLGVTNTFTDVLPGSGTYDYQVRATSAAGDGLLSSAVTVTIP